jgi:hypothetical protein
MAPHEPRTHPPDVSHAARPAETPAARIVQHQPKHTRAKAGDAVQLGDDQHVVLLQLVQQLDETGRCSMAELPDTVLETTRRGSTSNPAALISWFSMI